MPSSGRRSLNDDRIDRPRSSDCDRPTADALAGSAESSVLTTERGRRVAACGRRGVRVARHPRLRRGDDAARRAGRGSRAALRRPSRVPARGQHRARGAGRRAHPRAGHRGLLRPRRGELMSWVNAIIQGILLGGLYALLACGLSLQFGVMRSINLAHGDIAVVGAFVVWEIATDAHISPFLALLAALPGMLVVGYLLQVTLFDRSLRGGELVPLLTTFGLAIVIQNALLQIFSPDVRSLGGQAGAVRTASWRITDQLSIPALGVLVLAVAVAVLGGLQLLLARTSFGREMRATAQDPDTAALVGVNTRAVYARATAIAVATAT